MIHLELTIAWSEPELEINDEMKENLVSSLIWLLPLTIDGCFTKFYIKPSSRNLIFCFISCLPPHEPEYIVLKVWSRGQRRKMAQENPKVNENIHAIKVGSLIRKDIFNDDIKLHF